MCQSPFVPSVQRGTRQQRMLWWAKRMIYLQSAVSSRHAGKGELCLRSAPCMAQTQSDSPLSQALHRQGEEWINESEAHWVSYRLGWRFLSLVSFRCTSLTSRSVSNLIQILQEENVVDCHHNVHRNNNMISYGIIIFFRTLKVFILERSKVVVKTKRDNIRPPRKGNTQSSH